MKILIGSDHAGFQAKNDLARSLAKAGHQVVDVGCNSENSCDYPDFARDVALGVSRKKAERGVLICGTGIGMAIAANKVAGVRAAVAWNPATAVLAWEHNHANVLCLSARFLNGPTRFKMAQAWLKAKFGEGRHSRRVKKISKMESLGCKPAK